MIELKYLLANGHPRRGLDLSAATLTDLTYYLFWGEVRFRIEAAVFDPPGGSMPLLDFAAGFHYFVRDLRDGVADTFDLTECDAGIRLRRIADQVEVTADYTAGRALASRDMLLDATTQGARGLVDNLAEAWPSLLQNEQFRTIVRSIESGDTGSMGE
jgi:hypothetical protein